MSSLSEINKSMPSNSYKHKPAQFRSQLKLKEPIIINGAKTICNEINHEVTVSMCLVAGLKWVGMGSTHFDPRFVAKRGGLSPT